MTTTAGSDTDAPSLSIGEVAERTGLSVHALRFYEREGLLVGPVRRTSGGRRRYAASDVDWLLICVRLRESDMPLADLKHFAELVRQGPGNEAERLRLLEAHQQRVDTRIRELEECRSVIRGKVGVYADHLARGEAGGLWDPTAGIGRPSPPASCATGRLGAAPRCSAPLRRPGEPGQCLACS